MKILCIGCGRKPTAEIKDLGKYDKHNIPVWYCEHCNLSSQVKRQDRYLWVQEYYWDPPGFIYGERLKKDNKCLGCGSANLQADTTFLINEVFPFFEGAKPSWICCKCGFSDKVMKEDGIIWADIFEGWDT